VNRLLLFLLLFPLFSFSQNENEVLLKQYFEEGDYSKAKQLGSQLLNQDQSNKTAHTFLGHIAGYSRDWDKAIKHYKALTNLDATNADYH